MMDISKKPQILDVLENETICVYEFIRGFRISIIVSEDKIVIDQDKEFNSSTYEKVFTNEELDAIVEGAFNAYRIDSSRFAMAPLRNYIVRCIYYDQRYLGEIPQQYPDRGIAVVEIVQPNGIPLNVNGFKEFTEILGLPANRPLFTGSVSMFKDSLPVLKVKSWLSSNMLPAGFVIVNEPHSYADEGNDINRWLFMNEVTPDQIEEISVSGKAEEMAKEFVGQFINKETIEDFEFKTGLDAIKNHKEYVKTFFNYLKNDFGAEYETYYRGSITDLKSRFDGRGIAMKYASLVRNAIEFYIDQIILKTNKYINR